MTQRARAHDTVLGGRASSNTSLDDLVQSGLRLAFLLPLENGRNEARSCSRRLPGRFDAAPTRCVPAVGLRVPA